MVRRLWGRGGTWKIEGTSKLIQIGVISNCGMWPIVGVGCQETSESRRTVQKKKERREQKERRAELSTREK